MISTVTNVYSILVLEVWPFYKILPLVIPSTVGRIVCRRLRQYLAYECKKTKTKTETKNTESILLVS